MIEAYDPDMGWGHIRTEDAEIVGMQYFDRLLFISEVLRFDVSSLWSRFRNRGCPEA